MTPCNSGSMNKFFNRTEDPGNVHKRGEGPELSKRELKDVIAGMSENVRNLLNGKPPSGIFAELDHWGRNDALKGTPSGTEFRPGGCVCPLSVMGQANRALQSNVFSAGGALVAVDTDSTVRDILRPESVVIDAGAQVLSDCVGDQLIPYAVTDPTFAFYHQGETIDGSTPTVGGLSLTPRRCAGYTIMDHQLEVQSSGRAMAFLLRGFVSGIASALDEALLVGSGVAGQPIGVFNANGVGLVTHSAAATLLTALDYPAQIKTAKGRNPVFIAHPAVEKKWKQVQRWTNASVALWTDDGTVAGTPAKTSAHVAATDICCGSWEHAVLATWGKGTPAQLTIDPYSLDLNWQTRVVCDVLADTGFLRPAAFVRNSGSAVQ